MLTDKELQSLRNLGNEAEAAADEIVRLRAALVVAVAAMEQALAYADATEKDGYAEHWTDTKHGVSVSWSQVRRAIHAAGLNR